MIVLVHVLIALSGLVLSSYSLLRPSGKIFKVCYGLIAATLISGTYLVVSTHTQILSACVSGLAYLGFTTFLIVVAHYRLAADMAKEKS